MSRPVCVACQIEMRCEKTGAFVEQMSGLSSYRLISGDAFKCHQCGAHIVINFATEPTGEHYQGDYRTKLALYPPYCRSFEKIEDRNKSLAS